MLVYLVSTAAVSAVTDSSNKKNISDSKVFFVSPNDPEIDNATKMKLKFGNGMNLVAKGFTHLLTHSLTYLLTHSLTHCL